MKKIHLAIALIGASALSATASSFVASTTYGGHTYTLMSNSGITWAAANAEANASGAYLATFTTAAETTAVYSAFIGQGFFTANNGQQYQAWLGGHTADLSGTTTSSSNWAWVTGETWTAFDIGNFAGGEPNGDSSGLSINRFGTPKWNDEGTLVGGYIKETPDASSSLALLGGSFALIGFMRSRISKK